MLAMLLLATIPMDANVVSDGADLVELNSVYDGEGCVVLTQLIAWDWRGDRHVVAGWRLMADKAWRPPHVTWMEGTRLYDIRGRYWRETQSQFDPELLEREIMKPCHRRGVMGEVP